MKFHILSCLPAANAASCWALKTSGSRVAVSSERYSIFSSPPRTHRPMIEGSADSVNALQTGHSRSPKYCGNDGQDRPVGTVEQPGAKRTAEDGEYDQVWSVCDQ